MNFVELPTWRGRPLPLTREAIENEIERLIDLLDAVDGDPDLEPALGWPLVGTLTTEASTDDDREGDDEREGDPAEMGIADLDGLAEQAPFFYFNAHAV